MKFQVKIETKLAFWFKPFVYCIGLLTHVGLTNKAASRALTWATGHGAKYRVYGGRWKKMAPFELMVKEDGENE